MKAFLAIVVIVLLMVFAGWIKFSKTSDRAAVTIETKEIKEDTEKWVDQGKHAAEAAGHKAKEVMHKKDHGASTERYDAPESVRTR